MKKTLLATVVLLSGVNLQAANICAEVFAQPYSDINLSSYQVPNGYRQLENVVVFSRDGISRVDGKLIGIKGSRLNLLIEQSMPKTNFEENQKREIQVSIPMADLLMSTLLRVSSEVSIQTAKGNIVGEVTDVQKTQIKLKGDRSVKLTDIQSIHSDKARQVRISYTKETKEGLITEEVSGLLINNTSQSLWVLDTKAPVLHKIASTSFTVKDLIFLDDNSLGRKQKLTVDLAGLQVKNERVKDSTLTKVQAVIHSIFSNISRATGAVAHYAFQPIGASSRRYVKIESVTAENPQGLKISTYGSVEVASPSTRAATLKNRTQSISPVDLPKDNIYTFVITAGEKPEMRFGLVESYVNEGVRDNTRIPARLGLQPIRLAAGDAVLSEGEISIRADGSYTVVLYKEGDYINRIVRHSSAEKAQREVVFQDITNRTMATFKELMGYEGKLEQSTMSVVEGDKTVEKQVYLTTKYGAHPEFPTMTRAELIELVESSKEFRDLNPDLVKLVASWKNHSGM